VPEKNNKSWTLPQIIRFGDPEKVWEHYKDRGTPEERARLRAMLDFVIAERTLPEAKRRRA